MKNQAIKYLPYIIILALICVFAYLTQSSSKSFESERSNFKKDYNSLFLEKQSLQQKIFTLEAEKLKLEYKLKDKSKSVDVEVIKNADGSSKRTVKVRENEKEESKNLDKATAKTEVISTDAESSKKEEVKEKVVESKEKVKKKSSRSNWIMGLTIGAGAACLLGIIPACAGLL